MKPGEHSFEVTIAVPPGDPFGANDERIDALFEAGCGDATVSAQGEGHITLEFRREGELPVMVGFAISEISAALPDCRIERIDFSAD